VRKAAGAKLGIPKKKPKKPRPKKTSSKLDRILPWRDHGVTQQEAHAHSNWVPMQPLSGWGGQQPFRVPRGNLPGDFNLKPSKPDS
jgi:hypothetical protein